MKTVFTISREYGSGGQVLGKLIAESLQIPFYDKDSILEEVKKMGIDERVLAYMDEEARNEQYAQGKEGSIPMHGLGTLGLHDKLYKAQAQVIQTLAQQPCVIVGRCANYILKDHPNAVHVFIRADLKDKKERIVHAYHVEESKASSVMFEMDKRRAHYYNYYTDTLWGRPIHYDMVISTSGMYLQDVCDVMVLYANKREQKTT